MNLEQLRAFLAAKQTDLAALVAKAKSENRDFNEEETAKANALGSEINDTKAKIASKEAAIAAFANASALSTPSPVPVSHAPALPTGERALSTSVRERVSDDPRNGFKSLGEFATIVKSASAGNMSDERLRIMSAASGMNESQGADGGFLVPQEFATQIWDGGGMNDANSLLQECDVIPVTGSGITIPANAETSRVNDSRVGGMKGRWMDEAAQLTSGRPKFRNLSLTPKKLGVLVYATDELLADAQALSAYITKAAGEEINFCVGDAIINGNGAGKPLGVLNSGAYVTVSKESGQAADTLLAENVFKMFARIHPRFRSQAKWYLNQDVIPYLPLLKIGDTPIYVAPGVGAAQNLDTGLLLGRPVVELEYSKTLGDLGDVIFGAFKGYAAAIKRGEGVQAAASIHLRFDYGETAFRFTFRVDGQPYLKTPITPANGTNTVGHFVVLEAR